MNKRIVLYAIALALLAVAMKMAEYRFLIMTHSLEIYGGIIAAIFLALGIYAGRKLTGKKEVIIEKEVHIHVPTDEVRPAENGKDLVVNSKALEDLDITKREYEILELMARGLSNQEIAEQMFLSIHTVKTHASNLFFKLDVKRRTQAVMKAKELGLI
jgi:DNA-binding CsgD family transcriptional regulator